MPFFIIFLGIPFIEIAVFMAVGEKIGLGTTLLLALLTAIIGGAIIRRQGLATFASVRTSTARGEMPVKEIFDGFCLVAAGATLITPGFVTDTIGFLLLIPQIRAFLRGFIKDNINFSVNNSTSSGFNPQNMRQSGDIIDGEYEHVEEDKPSISSPDTDKHRD